MKIDLMAMYREPRFELSPEFHQDVLNRAILKAAEVPGCLEMFVAQYVAARPSEGERLGIRPEIVEALTKPR